MSGVDAKEMTLDDLRRKVIRLRVRAIKLRACGLSRTADHVDGNADRMDELLVYAEKRWLEKLRGHRQVPQLSMETLL